ncbi:MAG TPA: class I SAM-dependent methyltransferase [Planctomycetota bacterium]|jgi:SAM-dependent methyltransferase|nr:class I SAM-dependent methyltransferase [Planctomycetota bacterium]
MPERAVPADPTPGGGRRYRYLLGDSAGEAARLRAQARLWDPTAVALFDRLGLRPGWKVLEIGPGQGSLHMELRRRVGGPVDAVERSPSFAARLEALCARDGLGPGRIWRADLLEAPLPAGRYDLVFARWVFLFLPKPEAHLRRLVRALRPGGLLAIEDYHRETLALIPRPPEWADLLAADRQFFSSQGGDASIGGRLPDLYRKIGLDVVEVVPTIRVGRPGSPVWEWITTYFLGVMDRLAGFPPFTREKALRLRRRWLSAGRDRTSLLIAPAVLDVVGRKPSGARRRPRRFRPSG